MTPCGSEWKGEVSGYNHTKEEMVMHMGRSQIFPLFK